MRIRQKASLLALGVFTVTITGCSAGTDTDDSTANQSGHVGAVAIWQVCGGPSSPTPTPPDEEPPDYIPPPDYIQPEHYNLTLEKWSAPHFCFDGGANYWCHYTIRVENTGTVPYWGPIQVHAALPCCRSCE